MSDGPLFDVNATAETPRMPLARLADAIARWLAVLVLMAVAISVYEVVMRYTFNRPSSWAQVAVTALCSIGFAVGGAYAMARGEHIAITVMADRFRPSLRWLCRIVGLVAGAVYLAGLGWGLWLQVNESVLRFSASGAWQPELTPGPPNWPLPALVKGVLFAATLLFLLVVLERLIALLRRKG